MRKNEKLTSQIKCGNFILASCKALYGYPVRTLFLETMKNHVPFALSIAFAFKKRICKEIEEFAMHIISIDVAVYKAWTNFSIPLNNAFRIMQNFISIPHF